MLEALSLEGRVAIVTGGGTGLGRAIVQHLAKAGADVAIAARRPGPIEEAAAEVRALGRRALAIPTDVSDPAQVNRLVETVLKEWGKIDILVNNAGQVGLPRKPIWEITDEEWRQGLEVNLSSAFYCSRAVARHMVERGKGVIIIITSSFGLRGPRDAYIYNVSKGAMVPLIRTLAVSLGRYGIRTNGIAPGGIPTEGTQQHPDYIARPDFVPIGHLGRPDDIGHVALFLASDASSYMNGAVVIVDGAGLAGGYAPTGYAPVIPLNE
ncbi:2-dehydro-3-deoxy-D-gluconate 5-dehydrogenase [bacterium HR23]|nr:2-dehydro-3-deoxy-D-gluconate 5-dehydrogenase [bacterium HR23]